MRLFYGMGENLQVGVRGEIAVTRTFVQILQTVTEHKEIVIYLGNKVRNVSQRHLKDFFGWKKKRDLQKYSLNLRTVLGKKTTS